MDIEKLIKEMTLEEKAMLTSGLDNWHTKSIKRLNIDSVMVADGPSGIRKEDPDNPGSSYKATCYPTGSTLANTFNPELAYKLGEMLSKEAKSMGLHTLLGPAINIKRTPLGGRNFEFLSEDPFLVGELSSSYVKGVQKNGVGVSVKHFACNNQEYMRMSTSANVSERALREIYFPGFEKTVKEAHPWTIMCSYNRINGVYSSKNKWMLSDVLRHEWGFDGIVMTDWGAMCDRVESLKSGTELEMPSSKGITDKLIVRAVKEKRLSEEVLDEAVRRLLEWISKGEKSVSKENFDYSKSRELAKEIAIEGAVLLKNEDELLPLNPSDELTVIGTFADRVRIQGGGSSRVNPIDVSSVLSLLSKRAKINYYPGWKDGGEEIDLVRKREAIEGARRKGKILFFMALPDSFESEGFDRHSLSLPPCQLDLLEEVGKINSNIVVILFNGSAIEMPFKDSVKAILEMNLSGEMTAEALLDILYGEKEASGRLSETYPLRIEDNPTYLTYPGDGRDANYSEDIYVGYRYYDSKKMDVLFPFGYGLSYTNFILNNLVVKKEGEKEYKVSVNVKNVGKRTGITLLQLYIRSECNKKNRPYHELKGFKKLSLSPEEEMTVTFHLCDRSFSYWEEKINSWFVESGKYVIEIGFSSRDISLEKEIEIEREPLPLIIDEATTLGEVIKTNNFGKLGDDGLVIVKALDGSKEETVLKGEAAEGMINSCPLFSIYSYTDLKEGSYERIIGELKK